MKSLGLVGMCIVGIAALGNAQEAVTTLPDAYRLQFENEWVKSVRVHYPPHAKLPAHTITNLQRPTCT